MLRQFKDNNGDIHFITEEQVPQSGWVEIEIPLHPDPNFVVPYTARRMKEYPSITEQLDMLWHMMDEEVISGKGSEWYNTILAVKSAHPKPEE